MEKLIYYKGAVIAILISLNAGTHRFDVYKDLLRGDEYNVAFSPGVITAGTFVRSEQMPTHKVTMQIDGKVIVEEFDATDQLVPRINTLVSVAQSKIEKDKFPRTVEQELTEAGFVKKP